METNTKEYRDVDELRLWEKNPRSITKKDFERLKKQIQRLGMYKPVVITKDGVVLGGNMRLRAYKELGYKEIWVSVVDAQTEAKMLEYAMSDNDQAGYYEELDLANLLTDLGVDIPMEDYAINVGSLGLDELLEKVGPGEENDAEEAISEKKMITCPECGAEFPYDKSGKQ